MLRQVHGVDYISTPDALTAEVLEMRLIQRLLPQYNRTGTTSHKYCYVRLTVEEEWPRLVISKNPAKKGLHIGPLTSRTAARLVVEAIESVVPLRRCTVRMGRNYAAPTDAPVCSAAQLGVALCPCSGTANPDEYASIISFITHSLTDSPSALFALLHDRITSLAAAQRFEEAADMRDRTQALVHALNRQRRCDQLRSAGSVSIRSGEIIYDIESGVLVSTRHENQLFSPIALQHSKVLRGVIDFLHPHEPERADDGPMSRDVFDEVMCIARFLEDESTHPVLEDCSGHWASPVQSVPELRRLDFHRAA
jgi:DNA polymerase-3 subunit epsilon